MNILLSAPKSSNVFESFGFIFPPLGLLYVAASAEKHGHTVRCEDFRVSDNDPARYNFGQYDVVGITSDTRRFPRALDIAKEAKRRGCTVIMGGPHPAFVDEEILKQKAADFIVRGEGEITFPDLLHTLQDHGSLPEVKGISFLQNGSITRTQPRELIEDLDGLPFPARHLVDMDAYRNKGLRYGGRKPVTLISTSRGCPHECSFCLTPQLYGRKWRARSAESVVDEIEHVYHEYGFRAVGFCDDNFTVSPARVKEICRLIMERNLDIWWWCLSTAETLIRNEEMVELMSESGAKTVYFGVESANPSTLSQFNKNIKADVPSRAITLLREHGIETCASFILGGPGEKIETALGTIKLARTLEPELAQFSILTPYPGTALFNQLQGRLRHRKWNKYDGIHLVFRHGKITYVAMELLLLWAYARFYARGFKAIKGFFKALYHNTPFLRSLHAKIS